jgi:hypothetical protein
MRKFYGVPCLIGAFWVGIVGIAGNGQGSSLPLDSDELARKFVGLDPADPIPTSTEGSVPNRKCWRWGTLKSCENNYDCNQLPDSHCKDTTDTCDNAAAGCIPSLKYSDVSNCPNTPGIDVDMPVTKCRVSGKKTPDGCPEDTERCVYVRIPPGQPGNNPPLKVPAKSYPAGATICAGIQQPPAPCIPDSSP